MKRIILLGATGSIGSSTIDVVRAHPKRFSFAALSAHTDIENLDRLATEFKVGVTAVSGSSSPSEGGCFSGDAGLVEMIHTTEADVVVNGIMGAAGLRPSIAALESGKDLALANKESIVMSGQLIRKLASKHGRAIIPVDSEHSALFFLLERMPPNSVEKLILTASGGAFRDLSFEELSDVTVEDALAHPTWDMGAKITVDSATMANKGLELIEASYLFDVPAADIEVLIHRQSIVHAMLRSVDGSFYAQMSRPDMRIPIQHALSYPDEIPSPFGRFQLEGKTLTFEAPDARKYRALELARQALNESGAHPIVFNAANEIAVGAFMKGAVKLPGISDVIEDCLVASWPNLVTSFEQVFDIDRSARKKAKAILSGDAKTV